MNLTHRYIARITIEAETPIAVGSGEKGVNTDRLVAKDANGIPYIPGSSLTGVLRHSFGEESWVDSIFGSENNKGQGSRLIVSSAFLIGEDGKTVMDGLRNLNLNEAFYSYFTRLPERDHVRITHKGVADSDNHGKFDEELVHKGTRFVFEMELKANESEEDKKNWGKLLSTIASPTYRIGAGTRKGFGAIQIIKDLSKTVSWNLQNEEHLKAYLDKSSSLNADISTWDNIEFEIENEEQKLWKDFSIQLKAKDFFSFSAGFGDEEADNKPKTERYFDWKSGRPVLEEKDYILIPASSIKGALSHRVAFHYNQIAGNTIAKDIDELNTSIDFEKLEERIKNKFKIDINDNSLDSIDWEKEENKINNIDLENLEEWIAFLDELNAEAKVKKNTVLPVGENNKAVQELFGYSKNSEEEQDGLRGRVIIQDVYLNPEDVQEKVFNHTKIDRFTNATIDGALFQEKVAFYKDKIITVPIWVELQALEDAKINEAFERALSDLKSGRLALGGSSTKGHGVFVEN